MLVLSHPDRRSGSEDEEGPVSSGRELTLQGAGKSWVGVLPSSDLGLVGGGGAGDKRRKPGGWREAGWGGPRPRRAGGAASGGTITIIITLQLLPDESQELRDLPHLSLPPPRLF